MKFTNSNVESDVKDELGDLQSVLKIVAQLPAQTAKRILMYCLNHIEDDNKSLPPWEGETGVPDMLKSFKAFMKDRNDKFIKPEEDPE